MLQWVGMSAVCGIACTVSLNWYYGAERVDPSTNPTLTDPLACVFLFENGQLYSATARAATILEEADTGRDWSGLRNAFIDSFPTFPDEPDISSFPSPMLLAPVQFSDLRRILIEPLGDRIRVELTEEDPLETSINPVDTAEPALPSELTTLKHITEHTPYPIWNVDQTGTVNWHNPAYAALHNRALKGRPGLSAPLFADLSFDHSDIQRAQLAGTDQTEWYDIRRLPSDNGHVFLRMMSLRSYRQKSPNETLSKPSPKPLLICRLVWRSSTDKGSLSCSTRPSRI